MYQLIMNDDKELFVECSYCGQEVLREQFVEAGGCPYCGHLGGKVKEFNNRPGHEFSYGSMDARMRG